MTDLEAEMRADAVRARTPDKLDRLRGHVRGLRDLEREIEDIETRLSERKQEKFRIERQELPQLFMEAGVNRLDLTAEGNLPAYSAELKDHYHANIGAEWEEDRRAAAFAYMRKHRMGDMIKNEVTILLGLNENKLLKPLMAALKKLKIANVSIQHSVPWSTLTSWVREHYDQGKELGDEDLRTLGASVGHIVKLKKVKEDK